MQDFISNYQQTKGAVRAAWYVTTSKYISKKAPCKTISGKGMWADVIPPCRWLPDPLVTQNPDALKQHSVSCGSAPETVPGVHGYTKTPPCWPWVYHVSCSAGCFSTPTAQPNLWYLRLTSHHIIYTQQSHGHYKSTRHTPELTFPHSISKL